MVVTYPKWRFLSIDVLSKKLFLLAQDQSLDADRLELLKKSRQSGSVLNWQDRRTDLYEVRYVDKA
jgi:hypothetical protein